MPPAPVTMTKPAPASRIVLPDGAGDVLPTAPSVIVAACVVCGEERPAVEHHDGVCLDCRVGKAMAPLFDRLVELLRKQNRHLLAGHPVKGTEDQVGRQLRRMFAAIKDMVPERKRQLGYMNRALVQAQKAAA